jgi:hypothetical protein
MRILTRSGRQLLALVIGVPLLMVAMAITQVSLAQDAAANEGRVSVSRQGSVFARDHGMLGESKEDSLETLKTGGQKSNTSRASKQSLAGAVQTSTPNTDFWIYDASVELYFDRDNDGYYYGLDLWFDADTYYDVADVYAVVYLSYEGGEWNEYASTDDFTLYGSSGDDDYIIETDLMSGYPTGSYDLLIELFDAYDGTFIASMGPADASALGFLPLEDSERDEPVLVREVVVHSGGGSTGLLMLLLLMLTVFGTRRRPTPGRVQA